MGLMGGVPVFQKALISPLVFQHLSPHIGSLARDFHVGFNSNYEFN